MSDTDAEDKTEDPTAKRLKDARDKGQVVASPEVKTFIILLGGLITVSYSLPKAMVSIVDTLQRFLGMPHLASPDPAGLADFVGSNLANVALALITPFLLMMVVALMSGMLQTGLLFAPEAIKIDFKKINPFTALKRLLSPNSLLELGKSAAKLAIVGTVGYSVMVSILNQVDLFPGMSIPDLLKLSKDMVVHMMTSVISAIAVIAALDYIQKRMAFQKNMRMTKEEVKDEGKQAEGDPKIKGRLKQLRMKKASQRMMANVPKADVVITNPTHYAVALEYKPDTMRAPVIVAMGQDIIAEKIREIAKEHKIALVSNPPLARNLYDNGKLDKPIPVEQYQAVAEVISFVFRQRAKRR